MMLRSAFQRTTSLLVKSEVASALSISHRAYSLGLVDLRNKSLKEDSTNAKVFSRKNDSCMMKPAHTYSTSSTNENPNNVNVVVSHEKSSTYLLSYSEILDLKFKNFFVRTLARMIGYYAGKDIYHSKRLYTTCYKHVMHESFDEIFKLPDTYQSWFFKVHLHVYLCLCRLKVCEPKIKKRDQSQKKGLGEELYKLFVEDIEARLRLLGIEDNLFISRTTSEYHDIAKILTLSYDEGLLGENFELASALWRNAFNKNCDAETLNVIIKYMYAQLSHLDTLKDSDVIEGRITFILPTAADPRPLPELPELEK